MLDLAEVMPVPSAVAVGTGWAAATVINTTGSVPRPPGTSMLISSSGEVLGSLSGGCIEGAVIETAGGVIRSGVSVQEHFGYSDTDAFAAGLTCGGSLDVLIQPVQSAAVPGGLALETLAALDPGSRGVPTALIRRIDHGRCDALVVPDPGTIRPGGSAGDGAWDQFCRGLGSMLEPELLTEGVAGQLAPLLRAGWTGLAQLTPNRSGSAATSLSIAPPDCLGDPDVIELFIETRLENPRLLIFGANDFSAALIPGAGRLGFSVTLCDARPVFANQPRFQEADEVICQWPDHYLQAEVAAGRIDPRTVICILTHDPKFDIPLLDTALRLDVAYVGAMGSRRSHGQRVDALLECGLTVDLLSRLHSPIGLDLGAVTPEEVAVSITGEIVASRRTPNHSGSLRHSEGSIHANNRRFPWT